MAIKFYGRVIDQHGNPVAGAKVGVSLLRWRILDAGGEYHEFTTDSEGYFAIKGISGQVLTIRKIEKDGYEIIGENQNSQTFRVEGIRKNKSSPYVFQAWKKTEAEPLVYNDVLIGFSPDGQSYAIDLIKPKKVLNGNSGDIRVRFKRPLNTNRADWSVVIEGLGGGLVETNDVHMNQAPESGYQPVWNFEMKKDNSKFRFEVNKKFYLKSREGRCFGRLELVITPFYNDRSVIDAKYWINPNGSRNLQYDPSKRIPLKSER